MNDMPTAAPGAAPPFLVPFRGHGRVLHGRGARGIVRRIVQSGAHIWPRQPLSAADGDAGVALWLARLDDFDPDVCAAALDAADTARATAIVDPDTRRRAVVSRGLLRRLLAAHIGVRPEALRLSTAEHGRPVLEDGDADGAPLQFNLSHSGGWWLCATASGPVGVDLEMAGREVDTARLAGRVFTPGEQAALQLAAGDEAAVRGVFLDCWTRKEALLKALGTGFAGGARGFHVGPGPGDTLVATPGHAVAALRVRSLSLPFDAHAAIACAPSVADFGRVWLQGDGA